MATIRVDSRRLPAEVQRQVQARLTQAGPALAELLRSQAVRRIENSGDSQHRYPELWATRTGLGVRAGGRPLDDRGILKNSLYGRHERTSRGMSVSLAVGETGRYAVFHQAGFSTPGPNVIPLSFRARRFRTVAAMRAAGLRRGTDYLVARRGVTVPQRKLYNMPPENRFEIAAELRRLLGA